MGDAVPWGEFSTVGDIMMHVGDTLNTVGDVQYRGNIMINVGDILSTMGVFSTYRGGYHEYRVRLFWVPGDTQYRGGYHDARGGIMSTVEGYHPL